MWEFELQPAASANGFHFWRLACVTFCHPILRLQRCPVRHLGGLLQSLPGFLGLTCSDADGNLPTCGTYKFRFWQFNFREFNPVDDAFANDSIELLRQSRIDFKKNSECGVDTSRFAELLMSSGIVLNDAVHWVTFHSGYDFGYLLELLTCQHLPDAQSGFSNFIKMYVPTVYDIKHLMKFCNSLHGGLNKLA